MIEIMLYPLVFILLLVPIITVGAGIIALLRFLFRKLGRKVDS